MAKATVLALWSQVLPFLDLDASLRLSLSVIQTPFAVQRLREDFGMGVHGCFGEAPRFRVFSSVGRLSGRSTGGPCETQARRPPRGADLPDCGSLRGHETSLRTSGCRVQTDRRIVKANVANRGLRRGSC